MLKSVMGALIAMTLMFGPMAAVAAELKIGVADPDNILVNSAEGKRVQETIKRKAEELASPWVPNGKILAGKWRSSRNRPA